MPLKALTDDERAQRRQADRDKAREAVEALKASDGWQRWLSSRRHFHRHNGHTARVTPPRRRAHDRRPALATQTG